MDSNKQKNELTTTIICILSTWLKKWYIVLFVTCLCACAFDTFKTITFTPFYRSRVVTAITSSSSGTASAETAQNCVKSLDYILKSNVAKSYILEKTGSSSFQANIQTSLMADTNFYTIDVLAPSQKEAYQTLKYLLEWYAKTSTSSNFGYDLSMIEENYLNMNPVNMNNHRSNLQKAGIVGFVMSSAIIFLYAYLYDNIKTAQEINQKIDARLFSKLPKENKKRTSWNIFKKNRNAILITDFKTGFEYVEAVKKLTNKLMASSKKHNYQTILVTSSVENEGKSSVAVNIALALANNKKKVLLIDADLRKPSVHKILRTKPRDYIINVLDGSSSLHEAIYPIEKYDIDVLFSKKIGERAGNYLESLQFEQLLLEAKKDYDYIIIDSAPARYLADTLYISSKADATLLVVKQNNISASLINDTIYRLVRASANVIGCVYNGTIFELRRAKSNYHYRYGNYSYRNKRG